MIDSDNWLYPTFNGELRPDKPILIYWLMAGCVQTFGQVEWAFRLPSAIGVGIAAFATFAAARRLLSDKAAILAVLMFISSPLTMLMGTAATADGWLLGMTTAALASFVCAITKPVPRPRLLFIALLALFCGLAQLTKGPVALAIVGFPVLGISVFGRKHFQQPRRLVWLSVLALCTSVLIFLAWAIPANLATQGEFAARGIGKHVVSRMLAPMEGHGGDFLLSLPYYIPVLFIVFFPWVAFLPVAFRLLLSSQPGEPERALRSFVLWASVPLFVLMSLVATKLPHYVLPMWPALAIVVAHAIDRRLPVARGWRVVAFTTLGLCTIIGATGYFAAPFLLPLDGTMLPAWTAGALFAGGAALALILLRKQRHGAGAVVLALSMLLTQQIVALGLLPQFEQVKLAPRVARIVHEQSPAEVPILSVRFGEPTLVFYLWPRRVQTEGAREAIDTWKLQDGPGVLILRAEEMETAALLQSDESRFRVIAEVEGFNYSNGKDLTLVIIGRNLPAAR